MDLKELEGWKGDVGDHWYYASKAAALDRLLGHVPFRSVADIGAGSGFFAKHLLRDRRDACAATCIDINYATDHDEWMGEKRVAYRRGSDGLDADLYLLMDVLEHVENDGAFLAGIVAAAPRNARFVISVPAFDFLWSAHDEYLGHYRRYTLARIADVARSAGLEVQRSCYFFGSIFPVVAAVRLSRKLVSREGAPRSDMRAMPGPVNRVLRAVCRVEESAFTMNRFFGLTAFVLAINRAGA